MSAIPSLISYPLPSVSSLPANTADWSVDPDKSILLIHDMQRYFTSFFEAKMRDDVVRNIVGLRDRCAQKGMPVAYSAQPGGMTDEDRGLLKDFWGAGMKTDPEERQIVDALSPSPQDWMVTKWRYSAFVRSDLLERMRSAGRNQIILSGVYAHVGVQATAVEAFSNDIKPFFVADATADFSEDLHRSTLTYAAQRCAYVTTVAEVLR